MNTGTLYLCATPIGNLDDVSLRLIKTLNDCEIIACEDTRHTLKLLNHLKLKKKLISYHEHNEQQRTQELISLLENGHNIALVSDAGMPLISDPGRSNSDKSQRAEYKCYCHSWAECGTLRPCIIRHGLFPLCL